MLVAISCNEHKHEVSVIQNAANKHLDKSFVFDKIFGPKSQQKDLYEQAIAPIVNEALEGYNCTIFVYGQTGTGKTCTMEREGRKKKSEEFHKDVGMIPRADQQIFDTLESQNTKYSMKVTFLELYNEEITDLLVPDEVSKSFDDKSRKPRQGSGFHTLLNKQSNHSHSIFSITTHTKECSCSIEGIELIKCGKLNLVDLAGVENILRFGAREERAREAGEINKRLLTLGRVINALVDHSVHVLYRGSKLTRLLRDSLGGKTKTCIIATISPSIHCLEETLSTLDYAYCAKTIKNRPEVNQKVIKFELIKDLYTEIDRLKQEVHATREKNGIYIPWDHYMNEEAAEKAMAQKIEYMEVDSGFKNKRGFEQTRQAMLDLEESYSQSNEKIKEKDYLIFNLLGSEKVMTEKAFELHAELGNAASEVSSFLADIGLRSRCQKIDSLTLPIMICEQIAKNFHAQLDQQLEVVHETVAASVTEQGLQLKVMEEDTQLFVSTKATVQTEVDGFRGSAANRINNLHQEMSSIQDLTNSVQEEWETYTQKIDAQYIEDSNVVESVNDGLEEGLRHCMEKANMVAEHWRNAKDSLLSLQRRNVDSMNSIVKGGVEAN
ncbi:hypothetical protein ACSBR2_000374 [Camellia fascicularis]